MYESLIGGLRDTRARTQSALFEGSFLAPPTARSLLRELSRPKEIAQASQDPRRCLCEPGYADLPDFLDALCDSVTALHD